MVLIIVIATVLVSILCFNNARAFQRLSLMPYKVFRDRQWDRVLTHGFVHGSWAHLLINMLVFFSFGGYVFDICVAEAGAGGMGANASFALLYFGGLVVASIYDLVRYCNDPRYASIGASGAVSAVVFSSIFFDPLGKIYFFGIVPMWGILFGVLYLVYESWSARKGGDGVNHHAHIFGALYGFVFPMLVWGFDKISIFLDGLGLSM